MRVPPALFTHLLAGLHFVQGFVQVSIIRGVLLRTVACWWGMGRMRSVSTV